MGGNEDKLMRSCIQYVAGESPLVVETGPLDPAPSLWLADLDGGEACLGNDKSGSGWGQCVKALPPLLRGIEGGIRHRRLEAGTYVSAHQRDGRKIKSGCLPTLFIEEKG